MIPDPCCRGCAGCSPMMMCRTIKCACHIAQDEKAKKSRGRDLYNDPTPRIALARIEPNRKK